MGKAKEATKHGTTIPRQELCAAVLVVEVAESIQRNLDHPLDNLQFYSDSKVVLGYINNQTRRFYVYVANRVQRIRKSTIPEQWKYVPTHKNPADLATRPILADNLKDSLWYSGPQGFLDEAYLLTDNSYPLVNQVKDKELRPTQDPCLLKTSISTDPTGLGSHRFQIFSNWRSLIRAIAFLILHIRNRSGKMNQYRNDIRVKTVELYEEVTTMIIRTVQRDMYAKEISHLEQGRIMAGATIGSLDPYLDDKNILRVGGRIRNSCFEEHRNTQFLFLGIIISPNFSLATITNRSTTKGVISQLEQFDRLVIG